MLAHQRSPGALSSAVHLACTVCAVSLHATFADTAHHAAAAAAGATEQPVSLDKLTTKDMIRYLKEYTHRTRAKAGAAAGKAAKPAEVRRGIVIPADEATLPVAAVIVKAPPAAALCQAFSPPRRAAQRAGEREGVLPQVIREDLSSQMPIEVAHSSQEEAQSLWVEWMEARPFLPNPPVPHGCR